MLHKLPTILSLLLIVSCVGIVLAAPRQEGPPSHRPQRGPISRVLDAARAAQLERLREIQRAQLLRTTLTNIEQLYHLPSGTFDPTHLYHPSQRGAVTAHLQHSTTRMLPVSTSRVDGSILFVSPAWTRSDESDPGYISLLLFRLHQNEHRIVPLGFTRVRSDLHAGASTSFMDLVQERARASWATLQILHGTLRIEDP